MLFLQKMEMNYNSSGIRVAERRRSDFFSIWYMLEKEPWDLGGVLVQGKLHLHLMSRID